MLKIIDSKTAIFVTLVRAISSQSNENHLLKDPFAIHFLPWLLQKPLQIKAIRNITAHMLRRNKIGNNVLIRASYAEKELEKYINKGITQYIILGAGWDSFAFRKAELLNNNFSIRVGFPSNTK